MENLESVKDQISILSNMSTDGTKLSPTSSLRCRSRSCSRASSSDDSFNTAVNQVSQGYVSTPGYGLSFHPRGQRGHELDRSRKISRDSGFGAGTPMGDISDWSNNSSVRYTCHTFSVSFLTRLNMNVRIVQFCPDCLIVTEVSNLSEMYNFVRIVSVWFCRKLSRLSDCAILSEMYNFVHITHKKLMKISIFFSKLKMKASQLIEGSPTLNDLQKQWRKKKVSLYSSSPVKKSMFTYRTAEMLPLYVVLLTFGAGLFTLIVLNNALSKNNVRPSTAFVKPKTAAEKVKIDDLVDEFGNPLGGKKAAIQYYHNLNTQKCKKWLINKIRITWIFRTICNVPHFLTQFM